uniref:Peptidase M12A domain-containing protein n=1 Tax=Angiostrongylus cantonensis TaxID=6313 RepID=A0A0K0DQY5_ANGCA
MVTNIILKSAGKSAQEGFIPENPNENPFEIIATRAPPALDVDTIGSEPPPEHKKHFRNLNEYYKYRHQKYSMYREHARNGLLYRIWPIAHQKDSYYCPNMRAMFAYTCQPSKPLRVDLVEFCKDYSAFCNVPNFHRLPGPRIGPPIDNSIGHVNVNSRFGLGIGALPGFDVGAAWAVDVGPIPGMGENVGVGLG